MTDNSSDWQNHLESATRPATEVARQLAELAVPALTVIAHPDPWRVGERAVLPKLLSAREEGLSRLEPLFAPPRGREPRPLAEPRISRRPLALVRAGGGVAIERRGVTAAVAVDGEPLGERRLLSADELAAGAVLLLAGRVALVLHTAEPASKPPPGFDMVGESTAILRVRREIGRLAGLPFTVLLRGESGTGKELAARALHRAGPRHDRPFLGINVGAVPATLAASELFGAAPGAYSGARRRRRGYFQRADGGTLFLDEIGETPAEVQVPLLRVLESGEVQSVGAQEPTTVDVRVVAATDSDLESAIAAGRFRESLFHRLAGYEIQLPPLRRRREDFGRLFFHFLRQELANLGNAHRLRDPGPDGQPWVPAGLVADLATQDWPGNVRQLRNVVRQLVVRGVEDDGLSQPLEPPAGESSLEKGTSAAPRAQPLPAEAVYRDRRDVGRAELHDALRSHRWNVKSAAAALRISRTALYALIDRDPDVRKASELSREEIERCAEGCDGRLDSIAERLEVSKRALRMRMTKLGMG